MTDTRVTEQDKQTVHAFTQSLGSLFWQRTCFVLTYANNVENSRSNHTTAEYFADRKERIRAAYSKVLKEEGVPDDVVMNIPFIPAGHHPWSTNYILHDGKNWISEFWHACFARINAVRQQQKDQYRSTLVINGLIVGIVVLGIGILVRLYNYGSFFTVDN